jgi:hypothetical protein
MADETTPSVIPLHQVPPKKRAKTSAERTKIYRQRKRQKAKADASAEADSLSSEESLIPPEFLAAESDPAEPSAAQLLAVTSHPAEPLRLDESERLPEPLHLPAPVARSRHRVAPVVLSTAALALAAVGVTINGWFARSLGSSDWAGWLFFAIGVATDLVALVMPSCAAGLWQIGQRSTALVGWAVWLMTFVFAVTAGIGFASTNIADVTMARASRVTPAVAVAQAALADAMAARDRECKGGVGKFCREREAAVAQRRQALDVAMHGVEEIADPQTEAAIRIMSWLSVGMLHPSAEDFAMLRLALLALLPQIGGILLMVARRPPDLPR